VSPSFTSDTPCNELSMAVRCAAPFSVVVAIPAKPYGGRAGATTAGGASSANALGGSSTRRGGGPNRNASRAGWRYAVTSASLALKRSAWAPRSTTVP